MKRTALVVLGNTTARTRRSLVAAAELIEQTGASPELIRELEEFGVIQPERRNGEASFDETDLEIVRAAAEPMLGGLVTIHSGWKI